MRKIAILLLAAFAIGQEPDALKGMLDRADEAMRDRAYAAAAEAYGEVARKFPGSGGGQRALFARARALHLLGRYSDVLAEGEKFLRTTPQDLWAPKVRYLMAEAFERLKSPADASRLWRDRADSLAGDAWRERIAGPLLLLADASFLGKETKDEFGRPRREPEFEKALDLYLRARAVRVPPARAEEVDFRIAECLAGTKQHLPAAQAFLKLLEEHPKGTLRPLALLRAGAAFLEGGDFPKGRAALERVRKEFADAPEAPLALRALADALVRRGGRLEKEGLDRYRQFLELHPEHPLAAEVAFAWPAFLADAGRPAEAEPLWRDFLRKHGARPEAPAARIALATGLASMGRFDDAVAEWRAFLQSHPNDARWQEVRAEIPSTILRKAETLFGEKRYADAIVVWNGFLQEYPDDGRAPEVLLAVARAHAEAGEPDAMLRVLRVCAEKYRGSDEGWTALLRTAGHHESRGALREAIAAYEELIRLAPRSGQAAEARERLRALRDKSLSIRFDRIAGTKEPASLHVATRNVKALEARAFRVDLREYFSKKRSIRGIEGLAVDIVKPEKTASFDLGAAYEPWRLFEREEKLPFSGQPGAYVVVVSEEDYTATTLAVVSDLRLVVKAGPGHLFAWAFRDGSNEPWAGAKLHVAAAGAILEAVTGADGTARLDHEGIAEGCVVLAEADGHFAATEGELPRTAARGYQPTGYVFTDRPLYRPGETVRIGAFLRDVEGGRYVVPPGRDATVTVTDRRGVELLRATAKTDAWGVLEAEARIDEGAPLGEARIDVECGFGRFRGSFRIAEFRKPEFAVDLSAATRAVRPGEKVEVTIATRYLAGGALAGAPIRWAVVRRPFTFDGSRYESFAWLFQEERARRAAREEADEPVAEGTLVAGPDGAAKLLVETEREAGDAAYRVVVVATDVDRLTATAAIDLFATGEDHFAVVDCPLRAVRPQEEFRVGVVTVDAAHRPVARSGSLEVVASDRAEAVEARWPASTGADGRGELKLRIERPGRYLLRFGAAAASIVVEGESPEKEARLLADRRFYREGENARLFLASPATGVPALLTFETDRVIGHRFVRVDATSSVLEVPLAAEHAPNVFVTVSIPDRTRLLVAKEELVVFRWLDVRVTPRKDAVGPGEEALFDIETRDAMGRPVAAALAMSVVDEGIYSLEDDPARGIRGRFYDLRRAHTIATRSSFDLAFPGATRETNKDLLAEERRRRGVLTPEEEARAHVERAKEALRRGDREAARDELRKAVEKDANAIEARELLDAERSADKGPPAPGSPATPAEEPSAETGYADAKEAEGADFEEESNESVGIGGGAGGAKKGRGGAKKSLRAEGGGAAGAGFLAAEPPRADLRLTAYFSALSLRTGPDGRAEARVRMPESLTLWRSVIRGITMDTLVGETESFSATRKELLVRVSAPRFLTDRDAAVATTQTRNGSAGRVEAATTLRTEGVDLATEAGGPTPIESGGVAPIDWSLKGPRAGRARLTAEARAGALADAVELTLPVHPYGIPWRAGGSGSIDGGKGRSATIPLDLPERAIPGSVSLEVSIAPSLDAALVEAIAELRAYPYGCVEQAIHAFFPALAARKALERMRSPDAARLDWARAAIEEGLRKLQRAQAEDGSFGWWRGASGDPYVTALALWAAATARAEGWEPAAAIESNAAQAVARLQKGLDDDGRCYLAFALAAAGRADRTELSRLFRNRSTLSAPAQALLAAAHEAAGLPFPAQELRDLLRARAVREGDTLRWSGAPGHRWLSSDAEATAYALLAFSSADPLPEEARAAARWLLGHRRGPGFGTTRETGPSVLALLRFLEARGASQGNGLLLARLGTEEVGRLEIRNGAIAGRGLEIAPDRLAKGRNILLLEVQGDLELFYAARLSATLAVEGTIPAEGSLVTVSRRYLPLAAPKGPEGWSILHEAKEEERRLASLDRLRPGERMTVEVTVTCREPQSYVMIEDALPAGCEVLEGHETGPATWRERRDDRMVFFAADLSGRQVFTYRVQGIFPGSYAVLPAVAGPMYLPETHGRSTGLSLEIGEGARGGGEFDLPTPDALWARAGELFEKRDWAGAKAILEELRKGPRLKDEILEELLARLLRIHLELYDPAGIVAGYEDLRSRNPRRLPEAIADLVRIGRAYDDQGQKQLAIGHFRSVVASSWGDEEQVSGAYARSAQNGAAIARLLEVDAAYPEDGRASALLRRAADGYLSLRRADGSPMLAESLDALQRATARFPEEATAADAAYRTIELLRRLERHERAVDEASAFLRRHTRSRFLDDATFFLAESEFARGAYDASAKAAESLRAGTFPADDDETALRPSPFGDAARHLLGKIAHARGDLAKAAALYAEARGIPDAAAALAQLEERFLEVEPIVVAPEPGFSPLPPQLPLRLKNVAAVDARLYPVDLFVLFAVRPSLTDLHLVDLTGIAPVSARSIAFEAAPRYREHRAPVALPEAAQPGAYLVILKAGDLERSSILLVSDLRIETRREGAELRVSVFTREGGPAAGALVKVSDGSKIRASGRTDARGVFATPIDAAAAVVVEKEGRYAVARSDR